MPSREKKNNESIKATQIIKNKFRESNMKKRLTVTPEEKISTIIDQSLSLRPSRSTAMSTHDEIGEKIAQTMKAAVNRQRVHCCRRNHTSTITSCCCCEWYHLPTSTAEDHRKLQKEEIQCRYFFSVSSSNVNT
jgi:hypothetical protein